MTPITGSIVALATPMHDDGSVEVVLRVADPAWLRRLVWRQTGQVRVLAPAELVEEVARGALAAAQGHEAAEGRTAEGASTSTA